MKTVMLFKQQWLKLCTLMLVLMFSATSHAAITGASLTVLTDGVAPFDADNAPGRDSSDNNGIVRTQDKITYRLSYTSSATTSSRFIFTLPVGASWDSASSAASLCTGTGGGSISGTTLTCNRLPVIGVEAFTIIAYANGMANGAVLTPSVVIDGAPAVTGESVTVSAATKATTRTYFNSLARATLNGIAGYTSNVNFGIGLDASTGSPGSPTDAEILKGAESLAPGTTFQIHTMPGAYLNGTCSGITSCTQPGGPGTPILVTISNQINFKVDRGYAFFSPAINIAYFNGFPLFTPIDPNNTPADTNDDNFPLGQNSYLYGHVSGFDPNGISGQSNFGAGYSPEMDPSYVCSKTFGSATNSTAYACGSLLVSRTKINPTIAPIFSVVTEQDDISNLLYGDIDAQNHGSPYSESILPGQSFKAYTGLYSLNDGYGTVSEAGECILFDNNLIKLNALPTVKFGTAVVSAQTGTVLLGSSDIIIEYTNATFASDNDRRAAVCGVAGDGNSTWSTNPTSVGGYSAVTAVRYKYIKPLEPGAGLVMGLPFERTVNASSLALLDGTIIPWFSHTSYTNDVTGTSYVFQSTYNPAPGSFNPIQRGGRITTQPIKIREATTILGPTSIAPNTQTTVSITPRLIGAAVAGVDAVAKNVVVTAKFQDNCIIPVVDSLSANATYTAGNYGADGIPCTLDDGAAGSVSFALGDINVAGGTVVAPYGGATATAEPITFKVLAVPTASTSTKELTTTISATNDLTKLFENKTYAEDRTEIINVVINGAASFSASKSTLGVTGGAVGPNETFGYVVNFGNGGSSNTGIGYFVDVLPFDGDDNGTVGLGAGKFEVTSLAASMLTPAMGGVTIQYSTDPSVVVQNAVKALGQEDGNTGVNWVTHTTGAAIPAGVTAVRFVTNNPMLIGNSGSGTIMIKAPTINSTTTFTNKIWARTDLYQGDPTSFQVIRTASPVTIKGLDPSTLRGRIYLDTNANGIFDAGESGLASTLVKIECTAGACLTAPQGSIFSMMVDANGGYAFAPNAANIFASADGSGTAIANFQGVISGTWTITETPPTSPATAIFKPIIGTINGVASGTAAGRSITGVQMVASGVGVNYDFAERFLDGAIEVTKALTLPAGVTGPFDFTFTATCDLPVPNTQKTATLSYPSNTKVSITGIAANATCVVTETLPASPDSKYYWETPTFTALSPVTMPNGGVQSITATNVLSPTVKIAKTVTSPPTAVAGNPTQFDTTYRVTVSNTGAIAQVYDLKDQFGFDSDVSLVGVPTVVKNAAVSGSINPSFKGAGADTTLISGESIAAGTLATPSVETYDVTVRLTVPAGSNVTNNVCTNSTGQGLFNAATLSIAGASDLTASACSNTPTVLATNLVLQKTWVNAKVGEGVTIPATTGFSANTAAFDATAATPSSSASSAPVVLAVGDVGVLPVESFVVAANAINYNASAWSCFDGTNPALEIAQGGSLTIAADYAGKTLTCTLTNTSVVAGVNVTKTLAAGPTPVAGFGDQFDVTYRISVSNTNPSATVYDLSDSLGFDADATVVGTPVITKSANVGGVINAGFAGMGANTALVSTESIAAGSVTTPTEETYDIAVRVKVAALGNISNNVCTPTAGNGLFNTATLSIAGTAKTATACAPTPAAKTSQLTLKVDWLNALVGEKVTVPATTGLTSNTTAFDAVSSGSNTVTSNTVIAVLDETVTLPTPSFATAGNELFYGSPTAWVCTDGVNPAVNVAFGGTLKFDAKYDNQSVVCQVTYTSVVAGVNVTKTVAAGPTPVAGFGDQFDVTYRISVSNTNPSATVYDLSDSLGFDADATVVGTPVITKSANVGGVINVGFAGTGANTALVSTESIAAGSVTTPTEETYDIAVRVKVAALGNISNNVCTSSAGNGLFNTATLSVAGTAKTATACAPTPAAKTSQLTLKVDWLNALVGEKVTVPATTGLTSNTTVFDAVSSGSNTATSNTVIAVLDETVTLPTPSFATAGNELFYGSPTAWVCTDGVNQPVNVVFGGTLKFDAKYDSQSVVCQVTYASVAAGVNVTKTLAAGPTPVAGFGDQFDVTYRISVSNTNPSATVYDLSDSLGFDADATVVGTPVITKSANVGGVINAGFAGTGANTALVSTESIAAGSVTTPTEETYDIAVRVKVAVTGNSSNNVCTSTAGNGLFNTATLSIAGTAKTATACAPTPAAKTSQLTLKVDWLNALVGEKVTVPATTGLTSNTTAFDAVSSGSNAATSNAVIAVLNETVTLPTPSFATAGNELFYGSPTAWVCTDGVNPAVNVAFGGTLTFDAKYDSQSVVCQVTYTSVVAGVNVTKTVATGPTPVAGFGDQFDVTYRISVSNTNPSATVYDLSDSLGFDADATVVGTPVITKSANVGGVINTGFTGTGANTALVSTESIAAGSVTTPTEETYDIAVRVKVAALGNISNNVCTPNAGNGLFNTATLSIAGTAKTATACAPTPAAKTFELTLKVDWLNALVGEKVTVPATTGLTNNTMAFDAVSSGSNTSTFSVINGLSNETVTLPTPSFAIAGNELFYGSPTAWVCTDGVNPAVNVAFGGTLTFDAKYDSQSVVCQVTYASVVAGVTVTKTVAAGPTPVAGTEDEFDVTYQVTVSNTNPSGTVYSLSDRFGFEPNVSILGQATLVGSAKVSMPINTAFTGSGAQTAVVQNEPVAANDSETFEVGVRYKVLNLDDTATNACTGASGFGLFNQATLTVGSVLKEANACSETRVVKKIPLALAVEWVNAGVGAKVSVPGAEGVINTEAFDAISSGSNVIQSKSVVTEVGASLVLPTPKLVDSISPAFLFSEPSSWVCTDGSLTETVAFGGKLLLSNAFARSGQPLVCKVVYSGVQVDTVKLATPDTNTAVMAGDSIEYTLKTTVTGSATQRDLVLLDQLDAGLTVDVLPSGCVMQGQAMSCTLPAGAAVGEHSFVYKATVNAAAVGKVTNQVLPDAGTCSACTVSHNLWSAVINKTSDAATKKAVRIGDTINYSLTTSMSGGASSRDIVLTDTLGVGLTLTAVPTGCRVEGSVLSCTLPKGTAVGDHSFNYAAKVNPQAQDTVVNSVVTNLGTCAVCSTSSVVLKDVALLVTKVAKTKTAKIGDFVRYEVLIENPNPYAADGFSLIDQPAPGLSYVVGSMKVEGDADAVVSAEYPLTTSGLNLASGEKITLSYMMRVGASAGQGRLQNCAQVGDPAGLISSNRSCADITRSSDPDFEDNRVWGTVFEDSNVNGMQDEGEPGIPGVRLATVEGLLVETDAYGRYHIEAIKPSLWARGSNFIVKVDMSSLPEGSVPTTQNPLVKRLTQGLPGLFNFGFRVPFTAYEPNQALAYPVMLSAEGLFEFDRFDLLEDGRRKLKDLARHLKEEVKAQKGIVVSAYTDRFGSDTYNQALSIKRAQSIKAYLIKEGIAEDLIRTEGLGAARPLVQCSGAKSVELIACLAPNRRFEVSVQ